MASQILPTTDDIHAVVNEEMSALGGTELDCFDDGRRLFLRTVFPKRRKLLRRRDKLQAGVAVMAAGPQIRVHPYTFREVCRNGAVLAEAIQTRLVERVYPDSPEEAADQVVYELREAVRTCASRGAFAKAVGQMKSTMEMEADFALQMVPLRAHLPASIANMIFDEVFRRFQDEGDRSLFGLIGAVTSVARDRPEPEVRWRMEELGGAIPALVRPTSKPGSAAASPVAVG